MYSATLSKSLIPIAELPNLGCDAWNRVKFRPSTIKMLTESEKHSFFESKVASMMDRLYGVALRFSKNSADAEDLVADTLIKSSKSLDSLDDQDKFAGWIMRILSNRYISQWRRQKTAQGIFDDNEYSNDLKLWAECMVGATVDKNLPESVPRCWL